MFVRSTVLAFAALLVVGASSAHAADRVFGGSTRDGQPMVVQATERGDKLKSVVLAWDARCDDGRLFGDSGRRPVQQAQTGFEDADPNSLTMSRNARGRFRGEQRAARDIGDGHVAAFVTTVTGSLGRTAATGTLSAVVQIIRLSDRTVVGSCRTGTVRWGTSRRPGLIFGGVTSQQEPIVVRLNASRQRVSDLLFSWGSRRCEPPGYFRLGDILNNFPLRAGRFGDAFQQRAPIDGGGERLFDYDVRGSVSRTRARGTFSVRMADTMPDGSQATCETGRVTWSALSS